MVRDYAGRDGSRQLGVWLAVAQESMDTRLHMTIKAPAVIMKAARRGRKLPLWPGGGRPLRCRKTAHAFPASNASPMARIICVTRMSSPSISAMNVLPLLDSSTMMVWPSRAGLKWPVRRRF